MIAKKLWNFFPFCQVLFILFDNKLWNFLLKILPIKIIMIDKADKSHLRVYDYEDERHFHQIFAMAVAYIPLNCDVL